MKPGQDAQRAHDELLALKPAGVEHEPCELCPSALNKEVAKVADDRTYTEAEHIAIMAAEVAKETASITEAKSEVEGQLSTQAAKVEVLEAEKAQLEADVAKVQADFDAYKADIERLAEIATLKQERVDAVKAANATLPETFFTAERAQTWAEMTEAAFAAVVDGITALAGEKASKETAAFKGGETPTAPDSARVGRLLRVQTGRGEN